LRLWKRAHNNCELGIMNDEFEKYPMLMKL